MNHLSTGLPVVNLASDCLRGSVQTHSGCVHVLKLALVSRYFTKYDPVQPQSVNKVIFSEYSSLPASDRKYEASSDMLLKISLVENAQN